MKIYHNPRCSKSRQTLRLIRDSGKEVEIVEYLKTPPTHAELKVLVEMLGISPEKLLRKNETVYKEQFKGESFTDEEWLDIMITHPQLIERPIVIDGNKAVLGRPPETVKSLL